MPLSRVNFRRAPVFFALFSYLPPRPRKALQAPRTPRLTPTTIYFIPLLTTLRHIIGGIRFLSSRKCGTWVVFLVDNLRK
jgi:hypothetical protein